MDASQLGISSIGSPENARADAPQAAVDEPSMANESNSPPEPKGVKATSRSAPKAPPNADRPPGKSLLPLARVQKILKADKELPSCNKEATFLISIATEEFIKRLGQAGQQQAVREKRTTVQRKDVVTAVRRADEFVFLEEILSVGVPAPPPAPAKRKPKAASVGDTMNIKDAFVKGKAKPETDVENGAIDEEEGDNLSNGEHLGEASASLKDRGSSQVQNEGQNEGDSMDIS